MPASQRIVITGLGAITPVGLDVPTLWTSLLEGRSGAGPITHFDASAMDVRIACEVKGFDPRNYMDHREARRTDIFAQFSLAAASQALHDAGVATDKLDPYRAGVIFGSGIGGIHATLDAIHTYDQKGASRVGPLTVPQVMANSAAALIAIQHGLRGPNWCAVSACATGNTNIGEALEIIKRGDADLMVAGASDATILGFAVASLANAGALSKDNDNPAGVSRPF
ncbi:MAG: beta-ketoacyl-[acyl-carrier-protein] synthase II, partial [Anaerolineales bacterium]|nr:beta-ketoacyl-[acyl-carrier-protein] synthase II [Anaerolineales bacterium]